MDHDLTACLPPSTFEEPWKEYMFAAQFCECCFDSSFARIGEVEVSRRGDAWAVASRALNMLGRPVEAQRAWVQARALGGAEVEALATWMEPEGLARATRRAERAAGPGDTAEAWCEVAALRVQRGGEHAAEAVGRALAACPDHREALRWARYLALPDALDGAARALRKPTRRGTGLAVKDALALLPRADSGWLPNLRLTTRCYGLDQPEGPQGSALRALGEAGIHDLFYAWPQDYARVPARHPIARAEVELTALRDQLDEGRPIAALARGAWLGAVASGDELRIVDLANVLCGLGTRDESLVPTAGAAAAWLCAGPERSPLYAAYEAWYAARAGDPHADARARAVLADAAHDDLSWRLAVDALALAGHREEAARIVEAALSDPRRRAMARNLRSRRPEPVRVHVSARLNPRDLRGPPPAGVA